jgi:hypothetical protein
MGSLDYTPHTIHYWLSQVSMGLWDDSSFVRNAPHVIQADPQSAAGTSHIKDFSPAHLPLHLAFQEYHKSQPHAKYTLGVTGRPGGPDWYISTEDNDEVHGPNGQMQYDMPEEADPCFAKVISGFAVVDRVHAMPIKSPDDNDLIKHIEITSIVILEGEQRRLSEPAAHVASRGSGKKARAEKVAPTGTRSGRGKRRD